VNRAHAMSESATEMSGGAPLSGLSVHRYRPMDVTRPPKDGHSEWPLLHHSKGLIQRILVRGGNTKGITMVPKLWASLVKTLSKGSLLCRRGSFFVLFVGIASPRDDLLWKSDF
jgi:hypothetical protein